ncbi:MAG: ABC transporter permease, partial [Gemmatimonadetes bacterium]|nr:ABC transporter permease [Gemmatimonadota bacterium]
MSTPVEWCAVRLYRWLVRLYPPAFRRRFGRAMVEDFRELVEAEGAGAAGVRALRDLARSLPPAWTRAARGTSWPLAPSRLLRDLRFAVRALRRDPGFTLAAVGVLGLGIGAGTAVLGVVNAYLLRPLPYPSSDRLVDIRPALPLTLDEAREVLEIPLTWELDAFTLVGDDRPEQVLGSWVVPGFFEAYGIVPALGRTFRAEEGGEGGASVAILSHALWQRRFGGDPGVLGRTVRAYTSDRPEDAEVFTVVGVLPPDFWFHHAYTDFIAPLRTLNPIYQGRLHRGFSPERAASALTELARGRLPDLEGGGVVEVTPLGERYVADIRPTLMLLSAAVALVLLIACGNVAVLLAVRARRRARELSVRRALGAGRAAVAVQLVVEGLVLACLAGAFGAGVASLALEALGSMVPARLGLPVPGGAAALRVDATVLAALAGVCALTGLVFGLVPLAGAVGEDLVGGMRAGRRRFGATGAGRRSHTVVMAAELALSLALLVAAGLTVRSARHLAAVDLGIDPAGLITAGVTLRERSYPEAAGRVDFHRRLSRAVERLLSSNFPASRFLDPEAAGSLLERLPLLGITGGAVYDALVGQVAAVHDLPLASRDRCALDVYRALGVTRSEE